jgi:hypothetical protein
VIGRYLKEGANRANIIESGAVDLFAMRLRAPLQIEQYLTLAFEETSAPIISPNVSQNRR